MAKETKVGAAVIEVRLQVDKVKEDLQSMKSDLEKQFKKLEDEVKKTKLKPEVDDKSPVAGLSNISSAVKFLASAYAALKSAEKAWDIAKTAADYENLAAAFKGTNQDLELLRKATARTVDDASLMKMSNLAGDLGLTMQQQAIFMSIAENAADNYGTSIDEGMNKLIQASEGATRGLKNLGIQKKVYETILKDMLKAYGGDINMLDAESQKQIRLQAILRASGQTLDDINKKTQDNADKMEAVSASWKNFEVSIGKLLTSPSVMSFVALMDKAVKGWSYIMGSTPETANGVNYEKEYYISIKPKLNDAAWIKGEADAIKKVLEDKQKDYDNAYNAYKTTRFTPGDTIGLKLKSDLDSSKLALDLMKQREYAITHLKEMEGKYADNSGIAKSADAVKNAIDKEKLAVAQFYDSYKIMDKTYYDYHLDLIHKQAAEALNAGVKSVDVAKWMYAEYKKLDDEYLKATNMRPLTIKPKGIGSTSYSPLGKDDTPGKLNNKYTPGVKDYEDAQNDINNKLIVANLSAEDFGRSITSSLMQGIEAGERFDKVLANMIIRLTEMVAEALIFKGIMALFGLATGGAATAGANIGAAVGITPSMLPTGGGEMIGTPASAGAGAALQGLSSKLDVLNYYLATGNNSKGVQTVNVTGEIKNDSIYLANKKSAIQYSRNR